MDNRKRCVVCNGPCNRLGKLAGVIQYRCEACGWTFSGPRYRQKVRQATPEEAARFMASGTPIRCERL